jgi:TPR repeat protein
MRCLQRLSQYFAAQVIGVAAAAFVLMPMANASSGGPLRSGPLTSVHVRLAASQGISGITTLDLLSSKPAEEKPPQESPKQASSAGSENESNGNASETAASLAAECDRLAANPTDPKRPDGVKGVVFNRIDAENAIKTCRAAVESNPNQSRVEYELGRALDAGGQYTDALNHYRKAADAGYAAAMASIGYVYEEGTRVTKDLALAQDWYRKAVDAGDEAAKSSLIRLEQASNDQQPQAEPQSAPAAQSSGESQDSEVSGGNFSAAQTVSYIKETMVGHLIDNKVSLLSMTFSAEALQIRYLYNERVWYNIQINTAILKRMYYYFNGYDWVIKIDCNKNTCIDLTAWKDYPDSDVLERKGDSDVLGLNLYNTSPEYALKIDSKAAAVHLTKAFAHLLSFVPPPAHDPFD